MTPQTKTTLPDGYAEYLFREAIKDIIRLCGNPLIARGIAMEIVREETERRNESR